MKDEEINLVNKIKKLILKDPNSQINLIQNTKRMVENTVLTQAQLIFKDNLFETKRALIEN